MPGGTGIHPWAERRAQVIEAHKDTIKKMVFPVGFIDPYAPEKQYPLPKEDVLPALKRAILRLSDIEAHRETQDEELAPEYLVLQVNGIKAESLDAIKYNADGSFSIADWAVGGTEEYANAFAAIEGLARVEKFLRDYDERLWYSGYANAVRIVADRDGRIGVAPSRGKPTHDDLIEGFARAKASMPSVEGVRRAMRAYEHHRAEKRPAGHKCFDAKDPAVSLLMQRLDALERDRDVDDLDFAEDDEVGYAPAAICPHPDCLAYGEDCPTCMGSHAISHLLGMDGAEFPPPGWGKRT